MGGLVQQEHETWTLVFGADLRRMDRFGWRVGPVRISKQEFDKSMVARTV
jgi:hypothetical protein